MPAKDRQSHKPRSPRRLSGWVLSACAMVLPALAGCAIKRPIVKLHDVDVVGFDFQKLDLVFSVKVTNPNDYQISLSSLTYGLASGGLEFAHGSVPKPITPLSANETVVILAPVSVEYAPLAAVLRKARAGEAIPYELTGTAKFGFLLWKIPVKLKHAGQMPPLRKPAWHFRDVRLIRGPPSWLELSFEVENPNTFDLPLKRLSGGLRYGDETVVRINEPALEPVPAGKTAMLKVRARVDGLGVTKALAKTLVQRRRQFTFEGELQLGVPQLLRKMLLGKNGKDE